MIHASNTKSKNIVQKYTAQHTDDEEIVNITTQNSDNNDGKNTRCLLRGQSQGKISINYMSQYQLLNINYKSFTDPCNQRLSQKWQNFNSQC